MPYVSVPEIRLKHYLQVQAYMQIMGYDRAHLVSWTLVHGFTVFSLDRDKNLWEKIVLPALRRFDKLLRGGGDLDEVYKAARVTKDEKVINATAVFDSLITHAVLIYKSYA
jgi:hypothetical protein